MQPLFLCSYLMIMYVHVCAHMGTHVMCFESNRQLVRTRVSSISLLFPSLSLFSLPPWATSSGNGEGPVSSLNAANVCLRLGTRAQRHTQSWHTQRSALSLCHHSVTFPLFCPSAPRFPRSPTLLPLPAYLILFQLLLPHCTAPSLLIFPCFPFPHSLKLYRPWVLQSPSPCILLMCCFYSISKAVKWYFSNKSLPLCIYTYKTDK